MADMDWRYMGYLDSNELEYLAELKDRLHEVVQEARYVRSEMERLRRRAGTRGRRQANAYEVRTWEQRQLLGLTPSPDDAQLNTQ